MPKHLWVFLKKRVRRTNAHTNTHEGKVELLLSKSSHNAAFAFVTLQYLYQLEQRCLYLSMERWSDVTPKIFYFLASRPAPRNDIICVSVKTVFKSDPSAKKKKKVAHFNCGAVSKSSSYTTSWHVYARLGRPRENSVIFYVFFVFVSCLVDCADEEDEVVRIFFACAFYFEGLRGGRGRVFTPSDALTSTHKRNHAVVTCVTSL